MTDRHPQNAYLRRTCSAAATIIPSTCRRLILTGRRASAAPSIRRQGSAACPAGAGAVARFLLALGSPGDVGGTPLKACLPDRLAYLIDARGRALRGVRARCAAVGGTAMEAQDFSRAIPACRSRFGVTREALAAEAGLPIDQLRCFEAGLERPTWIEVELLACGFEVASGQPFDARRMLLERVAHDGPGSKRRLDC